MLEQGIYFQLDEEEYHALPALGSTNIKDLLCNPVNFYARSWMNPYKEEDEEENKSEAKTIGNAYHARILEGKDAFYSRFVACFDASEYPDAYVSTDDIKERLRELKEADPDIRLTGRKEFLIEQLKMADPDSEILDVIRSDYEELYEGMTFLTQKQIDRIEYAAAMIENHPELRKCFQGGYPEVSVIWEHPEHKGVMLKSRIDYLKVKAFVDLKTFANKYGKPTERAIYSEMGNYKYHIQACHYWDSLDAAVKFAKRGQVFGDVDSSWIKRFSETKDFDMYYVFQQKGIAPLARGKKFKRGSIYHCGVTAIEQAIDLYVENLKRFGTGQWVDMTPITDFHDDEFPIHTVEL